jgi:hypothetical protein
MADRSIDRPVIESAWQALGGRLAAIAGSLAALVSLISDAPPHIAALRGAAAWAVLLVISKLGLAALCRAIEYDRKPSAEPEEPER